MTFESLVQDKNVTFESPVQDKNVTFESLEQDKNVTFESPVQYKKRYHQKYKHPEDFLSFFLLFCLALPLALLSALP